MEILSKILGGQARVKIMRLFLQNPKSSFENADIVKRCRVDADAVRREMRVLTSVGFVRRNSKGYVFSPSFKYRNEMENLLVSTEAVEKDEIVESFKKTGRIKLLLVSGVFIKDTDARVDILIVGDKIKKNKVDQEIKKIEAEIGTELSYAVFETSEFIYRVSMFDKLVRDILDFPHEVVMQAKDFNLGRSKVQEMPLESYPHSR